MILLEARSGVLYRIVGIHLPDDSQRHLSHLGLSVGSQLKLISKTKESGIVLLKANRLAFDASILAHIDVAEVQEPTEVLSLADLEVGAGAYVADIFAPRETKRRLMDMGLTKNTKLYLRKVAPLGDPLEISLRGYELSLRKSEAQMISVIRLAD